MNNLAKSLDVQYPIFNAGMAFVAGPELAAEVSLAGGLGFIGAGIFPVPLIQQQYKQAKELSRQGRIGIDFLAPFFSPEHLDFVLEQKPDIAAFFYGLPDTEQLAAIREQGTIVWAIVNSEEEAIHARQEQVDAIVVQGAQAGGHNRAQSNIDQLFPAIQSAIPDIPLIIAGGIVTGNDVKNALQSGAHGVWCGTVFLASNEANAHADYKNAVVQCQHNETQISSAFGPEWPDEPMRVYRNTAVQALNGAAKHPEVETIGTSYIGGQAVEMPRYSVVLPMRDTEGDVDLMALTMGTEATRVKAIKPAREIVAELSAEIDAVV